MKALITNVLQCTQDVDEIVSIHLVEFDWKASKFFGQVLKLFEGAKNKDKYDAYQKIDLMIESESGKFDDCVGYFELVSSWGGESEGSYSLDLHNPTHIIFVYSGGSGHVVRKISEVVIV